MVELITTHPSINKSLALLHCSFNWGNATQEDQQRDLLKFLSNAPKTLRSLDVELPEFTQDHVPYLQDLCLQLEELSFTSSDRYRRRIQLTPLSVIEGIVLGLRYTYDELEHGEFSYSLKSEYEVIQNVKARLASMSVRKDIPYLKTPTLRLLDISDLYFDEYKMIISVLLSEKSLPLRTIVLGQSMRASSCFEKVYSALGWQLSKAFENVGPMKMCIQRP